jgi:hypothetical protein
MEQAEANAELVILSDWDHLTSDAYMQAIRESAYDILYEPNFSCGIIVLTVLVAQTVFWSTAEGRSIAKIQQN